MPNAINNHLSQTLSVDESNIVKHIYKAIDGLVTFKECEALYALGKNADLSGVIVEIGSFLGRSTVCLAYAAKEHHRSKVYAIDPQLMQLKNGQSPYEVFLHNIRRFFLEDWIIPMKQSSYEASVNWSKPISVLWIDGDHRYEAVEEDFKRWEKFLIVGGLIAFHDSTNFYFEGPQKVVWQYIINSKRYQLIEISELITIARKVNEMSDQGVEDQKKRFVKFVNTIGLWLNFRNRFYLFLLRIRDVCVR